MRYLAIVILAMAAFIAGYELGIESVGNPHRLLKQANYQAQEAQAKLSQADVAAKVVLKIAGWE